MREYTVEELLESYDSVAEFFFNRERPNWTTEVNAPWSKDDMYRYLFFYIIGEVQGVYEDAEEDYRKYLALKHPLKLVKE